MHSSSSLSFSLARIENVVLFPTFVYHFETALWNRNVSELELYDAERPLLSEQSYSSLWHKAFKCAIKQWLNHERVQQRWFMKHGKLSDSMNKDDNLEIKLHVSVAAHL